ncbi:hypothetical protein K504DRAFT_394478 [Pleomassaria siparia CBS 279.74]|uniref:SNF2 N-terminal domain-containing protein n=1 Tax=Pleomassaria siparia CBS 279.74 TaxID=1314801 RepID=A0A6G1JQ78_9PLEO|nr:hypothetical protein K504DRAFT_394478 [Pleomassaria siparia CBS 279.74]
MSTWLHKACGLTKDEAKSRQRGWVKNFAYGLANNFRGAILDEAQAVKNPKSQANLATRWLRLDWVTLLTATPIPWRTTDFGGLLLLIHDRDLDRQAGELADTGVLADPYLEQAPVAQHPFRATHTAFKTFINNDMDEVEQGRRLALVFDQVLIRRDFSSRCVINPQGDEHMIGSAMPKSRVVQLRLRNDPYAQFIFDQCSGEHRRSLMIKDLATGKFQLNGRSLRTLNLMSINPIFHFAEEIHDARSAASARYRQLFHEQKYEDILHGLLSNIVLTATREKFPNVIKDNLVP